MITKTQIKNTLDSLPENITIEQVIEHLIFMDKVQKGMEDSEKGRINTVEEAKQKLNKWLK
jgi:predicted transcriptional regulator